MDRLVLLPILPLSEIGYYVVAGSFAAAIATLGSPIADAVGPRYAQLLATGQARTVIDLFHRAAQATAVLLFPVVAVCCFFAGEVCQLWSRSREMSAEIAPILAILVVAHCVYVFAVGGADLLQAAEGSLRTSAWGRVVAIVAAAPLLLALGRIAGARGAAYAWLIVYSTMALALPLIVLRRWPGGPGRQWLTQDFLLPFMAAAAGCALVRALGSLLDSGLPPLVLVVVGYTLALLFSVAVTPKARQIAHGPLASWRREGRGT
jgi:O-antigen/teichoic acid export membrane protein